MSNISTLVNKGIQFIGAPQPESEKQRTIIVVGPARSGTSIVSGSLHYLGVFLGEKAVAPVFEDTVLADSYENQDIDELESVIKRYNAQHDIWSHKRPSILNDIETLYEKFRNPIFVFTFKDIFAIANRNSISAQLDLFDGLDRSLAEYQKIVKFIRQKNPSAMLISSEKMIQYKSEFLSRLSNFAGIHPTDEQFKRALDFISDNPNQYLESTRVTKGRGRVDVISKHIVAGWARYLNNERVASVELYVDDVLISKTEADRVRKDLADNGEHSEGKCAFQFDLDDGVLQNNSAVRVKITDEIVDLQYSKHLRRVPTG